LFSPQTRRLEAVTARSLIIDCACARETAGNRTNGIAAVHDDL
jgi:hypothetical protein